ncbi:hypothetical protein GCM10011328_18280 [Hafnia psychrotolerans]|uniref:Uncharacterized protein n=1 Tax=Hafnia psychrotolerans TaxID=1477018 RepID=A0ABQ1GGT1_9GAMM|nr:hypothetical protein GCM10011328_18280 [Hafnia psychrotolerans]
MSRSGAAGRKTTCGMSGPWCKPQFGVGIRMAELNDNLVKIGLQGGEELEYVSQYRK